jgi:hypothetical protein
MKTTYEQNLLAVGLVGMIGPLPQEREERSQRLWNTAFPGRRAVFKRKQTNAINATRGYELSSTVQNLPLSPGERAGVRASVPLTFPQVAPAVLRAIAPASVSLNISTET